MEVLLKLDLPQTRDFFSAFFALSDFHWKGFLSSRLSLPELIVFGLSLFVNLEGKMKVRPRNGWEILLQYIERCRIDLSIYDVSAPTIAFDTIALQP